MCGINWFIKNIDKKESEILIDKMNTSIIHRGPDDQWFFCQKVDNNDIVLSQWQVRLSIIDLTDAGFQPMFYDKYVGSFSQKHNPAVLDEIGEKSIRIVFNGEIYNYQEIKDELIQKWYNFSSNSDTEVVLASYLERWIDCVSRFNGMWAFAIYNPRKKELFCSRDRLGKKPFYYYWDNNNFIFSSEIKWIFAAWVDRKINIDKIPEFLTFHYTPWEETLIENIFKLRASHNLIFDIKKNKISLEKYWDIDDDKIIYQDFDQAKTFVDETLNNSVKIRTESSDVPVWTFLSWWLDSSLVSALFKKYYKWNEFHTFNVIWEDWLSNEWKFADIVSKYIWSTHHKFKITWKDVLDNIKTLQYHYCDPISEAGFIPNYFVSKYAKDYVKVVLTWDGADEVFAWYSYYTFLQKFWKLWKIPGVRKVSKFLWKKLKTSKYQKWFEFLSNAQWNTFDKFFWLTVSAFSQKELKWLLTDKFNTKNNVFSSITKTKKTFRSFLNQLLYTDQKVLLENCYNIKPDKALMWNSIEWRAPMQDYRLVEASYAMKDIFKIKWKKEKYILSEVAKKYLPQEILKRKKQGFGVPIYEWINWDLNDIVFEKLNKSELVKKWYLNKNKLDFYLENIDKKYFSTRIWTIFSLELFIEIYNLKI